jgi:hypothetical protein
VEKLSIPFEALIARDEEAILTVAQKLARDDHARLPPLLGEARKLEVIVSPTERPGPP